MRRKRSHLDHLQRVGEQIFSFVKKEEKRLESAMESSAKEIDEFLQLHSDRREIKKLKKFSTIEGILWGIMNTIYSNFLIPLAIFLSFSKFFLSIISAISFLSQLVGEMVGLRCWGKGKKFMAAMVFFQAISFLPAIFALLDFPRELLFLTAFFVPFFGVLAGIAWTNYMRLFFDRNKIHWVEKRSFLIAITGIFVLIFSTTIFHLFSNERLIFLVLFSLAFFARLFSSLFVLFHPKERAKLSSFGEISLSRLKWKNGLFQFLVSFSAGILFVFLPYYVMKGMGLGQEIYSIMLFLMFSVNSATYLFFSKVEEKLRNDLVFLSLLLLYIFSPFFLFVSLFPITFALEGFFSAFFTLFFFESLFSGSEREVMEGRFVLSISNLLGMAAGSLAVSVFPTTWLGFIVFGIRCIFLSTLLFFGLKKANSFEF